jgi:hypothetical protein
VVSLSDGYIAPYGVMVIAIFGGIGILMILDDGMGKQRIGGFFVRRLVQIYDGVERSTGRGLLRPLLQVYKIKHPDNPETALWFDINELVKKGRTEDQAISELMKRNISQAS